KPYLKELQANGLSDHNPNLEAMRGTVATVTVHATRPLASGFIHADGVKDVVPGVPVAGQPDAPRFALRIEQSGNYRMHFKTADGETNEDALAFNTYAIKALEDQAPVVTLSQPAPNQESQELPANGTLRVAGLATDDFGLTAFALRMK